MESPKTSHADGTPTGGRRLALVVGTYLVLQAGIMTASSSGYLAGLPTRLLLLSLSTAVLALRWLGHLPPRWRGAQFMLLSYGIAAIFAVARLVQEPYVLVSDPQWLGPSEHKMVVNPELVFCLHVQVFLSSLCASVRVWRRYSALLLLVTAGFLALLLYLTIKDAPPFRG